MGMPRLSQHCIQVFLNRANLANSMTDKGRALEDLICYVLEEIPGVTVTTRNKQNVFRTEEIDVAIWNERASNGLAFLPSVILIECKNWSQPVTSEELSWFHTKICNRGLSFGILIAANGITGDAQNLTQAQEILSKALAQQRQIVVITMSEILTFRNTNQVVNLVKKKLCDLVVYGGLPLQ